MKKVFVNRTEDYYLKLKDVQEGIENELTISHVLKYRNPFTKSGMSFGKILFSKLKIPDNPRILEVGPGLGDVAEDICNSLSEFQYTFVDICSSFINHLKSKFKGDRFSFITGDFLKSDITGRFDLIICNEVLADFPTILNMTLNKPNVEKVDESEYYDAVSLAKIYGLKVSEIRNLNYGAVKFLEKAKSLLEWKGKIFISEHSSRTPQRIRVYGHSEYTINFDLLEKVAKKLGFRAKNGSLTKFLEVNEKKAILIYTQPELKTLYNFFKKQGIFFDQKAYEPDEIIKLLENSGIQISNQKNYSEFLEKQAKPLRNITDQFKYLILEKNVK